MIILDDQHKKVNASVAGPTTRGHQLTTRRSFESTTTSVSLPDYETSQAGAVKPEPKFALSQQLFAIIGIERSDKRFWRAVVCALVIYVTVSFAIGLPFIIIEMRKHHGPPPASWDGDDDDFSLPPSSNLNLADLQAMDGRYVNCDNWNTRDVPGPGSLLSSRLLYVIKDHFDFDSVAFHSNYSHDNQSSRPSFGTLNVDRNPDSTQAYPTLTVDMHYSSKLIRDQTTVCVMDYDGEVGITLYIPKTLKNSDILTFDINLLLPQSPYPLYIPELVTYLPLFTQQFGDLSPNFNFGKITLEGPASPISVTSLRGNMISVKTSQAEINGMFNVTSSLKLDTISASINAQITLVHDYNSRDGPTSATLATGNSNINSNVSLITGSQSEDMQFDIRAKTFNGPLDLVVSHSTSTPPSVYGLRANNNLGTTNVTVDSKFEGIYDVQTKFATVDVLRGPEASTLLDPYGGDQKRLYDDDLKTKSRVVGWVGWKPRPRRISPRWLTRRHRHQHRHGHHGPPGEGFLIIESSLSPVGLTLSQVGEGVYN